MITDKQEISEAFDDFDLESIESDIIARLKRELPKAWNIDGFPDDPSTYKMGAKTAVLVVYNGSDFGAASGLNGTGQLENELWQVSVLSRSLKKSGGAYGAIRSVIYALSGYQINDYRLIPSRVQYVPRADTGVWQYNILFRLDQFFNNESNLPEIN